MRKRVEETLDLLGPGRPAATSAAHPVRRRAAARGHRLGAHHAPARPRAGRADVGARPAAPPRRSSPPCNGWCTTWASPSCSPSTGWSAWSSTPTASSASPGDGGLAERRPGRDPRGLAGRSPGRRARPPGRLGTAPAVGARRAPPRGPAPRPARARAPRRPPAAPRESRHTCQPPYVRRLGTRSPCAHGSKAALLRVDLAVRSGEVVAVMGRNGAGKSTLLGDLVGAPSHRTRATSGSAATRRTPSAPTTCSPASGSCRRRLRPAARRDRRRRSAPRPTRTPGAAPGTTAGPARRLRPGHRADGPPPGPLRGPAPGSRALSIVLAAAPPCCCSTSRPAVWTTRPSARLVEVLRALRRSRHRGRPRDARRRARRRGGRPGRRAGRRRGRRRRPDRRGRRLLTRLRPSGRQDPGAAAVADGRGRSRRAAGGGMTRPVRRAAPPRSATRARAGLDGRGRRLRLAAARQPGHRPGALGRRAAVFAAAAPAAARRSSSRRSPTAAWTRRPWPCWASSPRPARRCDRSAAASPASRRSSC